MLCFIFFLPFDKSSPLLLFSETSEHKDLEQLPSLNVVLFETKAC